MHKNWCNKAPLEKSQNKITLSKSSNNERCYRSSYNCCRAKEKEIEVLMTAEEQKEKGTVD